MILAWMKTNLLVVRLWRRVILIAAMLAFPAGCLAQGAAWVTNTSMTSPHYWHTATLLPSGEVLVAGGYDNTGSTTNAELYNPAAKTWTVTGGMNDARADFTATLLTNGQVLVAGGTFYQAGNFWTLASAELFDPTTGTWTNTGSMATARYGHTATLLPNEQVLVAGGTYFNGVSLSDLTNCELYDPSTGTWAATGGLNEGRAFHTATLLPSGMVLVAGGEGESEYSVGAVSSAELYDPASGTWTMTANPMNSARMLHTATLMPSGQVLVVGGYVGDGSSPTSSAELFNPNTEVWTATATPLKAARAEHAATLLPDGTVLVAGGYSSSEYVGAMSSAEIYDAATGVWDLTNQMNSARGDFTATALTNGDVLIAGGIDNFPPTALSSTELYGPNSTTLYLNGTILNPSGAFQVGFAAFPHSTNTIGASTNLALPLSDWTSLGAATEFSPGLFIFTDTDAVNHACRFYRASGP